MKIIFLSCNWITILCSLSVMLSPFVSNAQLINADTIVKMSVEMEAGAIPARRDSGHVSSGIIHPTLPTTGNGRSGFSLLPKIGSSGNSLSTSVTSFDETDVRLNALSIYPQLEPHISINKTNPLNIIISFNSDIDWQNHPNSRQGYYYSLNGGLTWAGSDFLPNEATSYGVGDPSTCFDAQGNGYIGTLFPTLYYYNLDPTQPPVAEDPVGYGVQKTTDGGINWQAQVVGAGNPLQPTWPPVPFYDKSMITCDDMASSLYANNFYGVWSEFTSFSPHTGSIKINESKDDLVTFQTPITLRSGAGFGWGANVKTGPSGQVYVCWADYLSAGPASSIGFAVSTDDWVSHTTTTAFLYKGISEGGFPGGSPEIGIRTPDYPAMAVDKSCGTHRGRIYIAYAENITSGGFDSRIKVKYSDNDGQAWSVGEIVNILAGRQNYMPWIAVDDATGLVCVAYYSLDQPSGLSTNTYLAYSTDGGDNWANQLVSDVTFTTKPVYGSYMGDYIGVTAYGGNAYVAWMDNRLGDTDPSHWQTYVSKVTFDAPILVSGADLFIKDTPTDDGTEPNANQPWLLVDGTDVWTRNTADGGTQHQSPEFTGAWATNPATRPVIYTKVRNRGCSAVTGELHLYYHKFTTNDHWNTCNASNLCGSWEEILCGDINGNALIDGAETACSNIITLASGQEVTVNQVWNNVAQTAIFTDPNISGSRQQWCLLARLVSAADPINGELLGVSAANNAKASNNIVQKNLTIVNNIPGIICDPFDFGNVSLERSINQLNIIDASATPFNGTEGLITIDLGQTLYDAWVQGGKQGSGIIDGRNKYNHMSATGVIHNHSPLTIDASPYKINLTSSSSSLRNISLPPQEVNPICPMFNYYSGPASTIPFEYYFVQFESLNNSPMKYTGAVKYYINKPECPNVNAGADVTIGRQCSTILTASPIIAGATYVWRNNNTGAEIGTGSSISVSPYITTTYELELNTPNKCIAYDIVTVTVNPQISCQIVSCPIIEFKNRTLTKSETITGREVAVEGTLRIPNNKTLVIDNSTLNLMKDAQIEVMPGGRLEIINSELRGCNPIDKWKGIVVKGNNSDIHQIKITGSTIRDAVAPLMATSVTGLYVESSTFEYAATAIEISAGKDFKIKSNQFYATETAIKTNGTLAGTASVIEKNYITEAKTAIRFNADNHSKLNISCNTFDAYTDYAIYSDKTILATQGTITEGTGNTFVSGSTLLNNKLRHNGNAMTYYYDPSVPVALSSGSGLTAIAAPSQQDATCYSNVSARHSLVQTEFPAKDKKAYKLYPNPNNGSMNFEYQLSETETGNFIIYDVTGRKVADYLLEQSKNIMSINESDLTNGLYFYAVIVNGKVAVTNKIVIIK